MRESQCTNFYKKQNCQIFNLSTFKTSKTSRTWLYRFSMPLLGARTTRHPTDPQGGGGCQQIEVISGSVDKPKNRPIFLLQIFETRVFVISLQTRPFQEKVRQPRRQQFTRTTKKNRTTFFSNTVGFNFISDDAESWQGAAGEVGGVS